MDQPGGHISGQNPRTCLQTGRIRSYNTVDAYLGYVVPKLFTTVQAGVSNLFNSNNMQVYGAPSLGRIAYLGLLVEIK